MSRCPHRNRRCRARTGERAVRSEPGIWRPLRSDAHPPLAGRTARVVGETVDLVPSPRGKCIVLRYSGGKGRIERDTAWVESSSRSRRVESTPI